MHECRQIRLESGIILQTIGRFRVEELGGSQIRHVWRIMCPALVFLEIQKRRLVHGSRFPDQPEQAVSTRVRTVETARLLDAFGVFGLAGGDLMSPGVSSHRHTPTVRRKRIFLTFLRGAPFTHSAMFFMG